MLRSVGPGTYNVWKAGALVDAYGFSGGTNFQEWSKYRWEHWINLRPDTGRGKRKAILVRRDACRIRVALPRQDAGAGQVPDCQ